MKRVYTDAVGDLFHSNHSETFRQAKEFGDCLIVGIHSDDTVKGYKRVPIMDEITRYRIVRAHPLVDIVVEDAPLQVTAQFLDDFEVSILAYGGGADLNSLRKMYGPALDRKTYREVGYKKGVSTTNLIKLIALEYAGKSISKIPELNVKPEYLALHGTQSLIPTENVTSNLEELWKNVPKQAITEHGDGIRIDKVIKEIVSRGLYKNGD
jgi:cytidyltransferase-like protein